MNPDSDHPWFRQAVERLEPRERDRLLLVTSHLPEYARSLAQLVGSEGMVRVVEPIRHLAEEIAALDLPQLEILSTNPGAEDRFGIHDGLLGCPFTMPLWPLSNWAELAVHNLRPGGRFVIDLPGEALAEPIALAWEEIGGDPDALRQLQGVSERELAASLRQRGLRQVEAAMATHLLRIDSPAALAEELCDGIGDRSRLDDLTVALTRRLRTARDAEIIVRRTRVHGIR